jgi:hypothetical protein
MMKKFYIFVICVIATGGLHAQITLTSSNNTPSIGDSFRYMIDLQTTVMIGQGGANQTWDLTGAVQDTAGTLKYVDVSTGAGSSNFPDANILEISAGAESYLSKSSSGLNFEGNYVPSYFQLVYTDKRENLKFPMTYNDVFNETFAGTLQNLQTGQTVERSGTLEIKADGYGDLELPYGTISNVLRVMHVAVYVDTFNGMHLTDYRDTVYTWHNAQTGVNVASYSVNYTNGSKTVAQFNYLQQSDVVTGIKKPELNNGNLSLYPNPSSETVYIKNNGDPTVAGIFDVNGNRLQTVELQQGQNSVNISALNPGVYFLRNTARGHRNATRFVVK